jgi:hypothetical protein
MQYIVNVFESEDDNKKLINLIHGLWKIQNGKRKTNEGENNLKPHIIAEFKRRLASRMSDASS